MPITKNLLLGALMTFALLAGLSMASGFRIESIAVVALLGVALCGGGFIFWRLRQDKASIGLVHHWAGWVLPLFAAVGAYAWIL